MPGQRRGGFEGLQINGVRYDVKGSVTYSLGGDKRDAIIGADGLHGFKVSRQVPYLECTITDADDLRLEQLINTENATITANLMNGKTLVFSKAYYAGEGQVTTEEGEISARFEAASAEEI